MTTTTAEIPYGERLAPLETRVEHVEQQVAQIRDDIRNLRDYVRGKVGSLREEIGDLRTRMDRQFLWILGIIITMWISLVVLSITATISLSNKL